MEGVAAEGEGEPANVFALKKAITEIEFPKEIMKGRGAYPMVRRHRIPWFNFMSTSLRKE